jgi:hypothetical protein
VDDSERFRRSIKFVLIDYSPSHPISRFGLKSRAQTDLELEMSIQNLAAPSADAGVFSIGFNDFWLSAAVSFVGLAFGLMASLSYSTELVQQVATLLG